MDSSNSKRQSNGTPWPRYTSRISVHPRLAIFFAMLAISILLGACATATPAPEVTPTPTVAAGTVEPSEDESASEESGESVSSVQEVATAVSERTPVPTQTPDRIDRQIESFTNQTGLAGRAFLGLSVENWINIGVSALIILVGYIVFATVLKRFSRWAVSRTQAQIDDDVLAYISKYINWLLLVLLVRYAILRLDFLGDSFRTLLQDVFSIVIVVLAIFIGFDLIQFFVNRYEEGLKNADDQRKLAPVIVTAKRVAQSIVLIIAVSIILIHFGFEISIIAAILIIAGFVISFGAQDILEDVLSGYAILIDQPFRVGDSIHIKELNTRGTVFDIATRSTHVKTGDNREVIIPNSSIGQSQVVNYTYPDPTFRVETDIGVAYGSDDQKMRTVIEQTVRGVEGVLPDHRIDIYYLEFGGSARTVRVRWWIDNYRDEKPMLNDVNLAIEEALTEAGIDLPFNTYDLNVKMGDAGAAHLARTE